MITAFLTSRLLGLAKGWWILIVIAALASGYLLIQARENADDKRNQEIGASNQREGDLRATITNVEKANHTAEEIDRSTDTAFDECLQNARNPADC